MNDPKNNRSGCGTEAGTKRPRPDRLEKVLNLLYFTPGGWWGQARGGGV